MLKVSCEKKSPFHISNYKNTNAHRTTAAPQVLNRVTFKDKSNYFFLLTKMETNLCRSFR